MFSKMGDENGKGMAIRVLSGRLGACISGLGCGEVNVIRELIVTYYSIMQGMMLSANLLR